MVRLPILDYEHRYPQPVVDAYAELKPAFASTGSPTLDGGLNMGAASLWQFTQDPTLPDRTAKIVTYRSIGVLADWSSYQQTYTTSGCHTDLWSPRTGTELPESSAAS
jgi:hypothetical protein